MKLGDKLYRLRKEQGISQEVLSIELNCSRTAIRKWEQNESKPGIDNLLALCNFFDTDIYSLLEDVSNVDFSHGKFEGPNYVFNPNNSTIHINDNKDILQVFTENNHQISMLVKKQQELLELLVKSK